MQEIHLICAADIHLGRHVGRSGEKSFVIHTWERLIETCLTTTPKIDALLLAGDILDSNGLFIEMSGLIKKGIRRLIERGIEVIAIAGNHDAKILERIHASMNLPGFSLLGSKGEWERRTCTFGNRVLHIDGLSFTSSFMQENPFSHYKLENVSDEEILIGLLHCDWEVSGSKYAPVRKSDFLSGSHRAWFLGHVHIPRELSQKPLIRYCGSLQGLDKSESGSRGALHITIDSGGNIASKEIPLAYLYWDKLEIDVTDLQSDDWESELLEKTDSVIAGKILGSEHLIEEIGLHLIFTGRTKFFRELRRNIGKFFAREGAAIVVQEHRIPYFIESIDNQTRPAYDIERLKEGNDPVAILAKKLCEYKENPLLPEYLQEYMETEFRNDSSFRQCESAFPSKEEYCELFLSRGYELLDELLAQKQM